MTGQVQDIEVKETQIDFLSNEFITLLNFNSSVFIFSICYYIGNRNL